MNVIFHCAVCRESLSADDEVVAMTRDVRRDLPGSGSIDARYEADDQYVHHEHETAAELLGFRRRATGTLMQLEANRRGE